jgi:hypothetical protein
MIAYPKKLAQQPQSRGGAPWFPPCCTWLPYTAGRHIRPQPPPNALHCACNTHTHHSPTSLESQTGALAHHPSIYLAPGARYQRLTNPADASKCYRASPTACFDTHAHHDKDNPTCATHRSPPLTTHHSPLTTHHSLNFVSFVVAPRGCERKQTFVNEMNETGLAVTPYAPTAISLHRAVATK